jgi:hypothetical protein
MYYQQGNHADIAQKKIQYLYAYIRERFGLKTNEINEEFKAALIQKTGLSRLEIELLFGEIAHIQRNDIIAEYDLLSINRRIEDFYHATR